MLVDVIYYNLTTASKLINIFRTNLATYQVSSHIKHCDSDRWHRNLNLFILLSVKFLEVEADDKQSYLMCVCFWLYESEYIR